eukprot:m.244661 g.244661  ORF g.244661 m.244661 type:complete len:368 (-) comp17467_c0_seq16:29-1132(-)
MSDRQEKTLSKEITVPRCTLINDSDPVASQFICGICLELVLRDKVVETKCGHLFDQECLAALQPPRSCPSCRTKSTEPRKVHPKSAMYRILGQLQVQCQLCQQWTGDYADYAAHTKDCAKRTVSCVSCDATVRHDRVTEHFWGAHGKAEHEKMVASQARAQAKIISLQTMLKAKEKTIANLNQAMEAASAPDSKSPSPSRRLQQRFDPSMSRKERQAWKQKQKRLPNPAKREADSAHPSSSLFSHPNSYSVDTELSEAVKNSFNFAPTAKPKPTTKLTTKPTTKLTPAPRSTAPQVGTFSFGPTRTTTSTSFKPAMAFQFGTSRPAPKENPAQAASQPVQAARQPTQAAASNALTPSENPFRFTAKS